MEIGTLGGVRWELALCLLFIWAIVAIAISKGIKTTGKVMYNYMVPDQHDEGDSVI